MSDAVIGFLAVFGIFHFLLIIIPVMHTLKAAITIKSKLFWVLFLLLIPLIGVVIFHYRYRASLFQGKGYESSPAEERARSGTLSPDDNDY